MVVLKLYLDNIFAFKDFTMDFSYPRKVSNSLISNENLKGFSNFRYKKVNIILGANASGKTTLGKALMYIFNFLKGKDINDLSSLMGNSNKAMAFSIDFVHDGKTLERIECTTNVSENKEDSNNGLIKELHHYTARIGTRDSYETAVEKLTEVDQDKSWQDKLDSFKYLGWLFTYPSLAGRVSMGVNFAKYDLPLDVLNAVLRTMDPSIRKVERSSEIKDTYIIRKGEDDIVIQDGKIQNDKLSSGTIEGIDISFFIASIIEDINGFYYCDERFSYVHSEIEKRLLGIMISHLWDNSQLFFTTHNMDIVSMNLPKHSYTILSRCGDGDDIKFEAKYASDYLKKNRDSLRNALENDVFHSLPDESELDELESKYPEVN